MVFRTQLYLTIFLSKIPVLVNDQYSDQGTEYTISTATLNHSCLIPSKSVYFSVVTCPHSMCTFYIFLFDCGGSVTVIVQCPGWNHGANRPCHNPTLYFIQGPWRHCRSNHNNERCPFNLELFAGRNLRIPILTNSTPERVDMLYLDNDMTDEEGRGFTNANRAPYNPEYYPPNATEDYHVNRPVDHPTNTTDHYSSQNGGGYSSNSTSYRPSDLSAEQLRLINRPGANSHFDSIQRFDDGSAWVRWERD